MSTRRLWEQYGHCRREDCGSRVRIRLWSRIRRYTRGVDCGARHQRGKGQVLNLILSLWHSKG